MKLNVIVLSLAFLATACGANKEKDQIDDNQTEQASIPIPTQVYENIQNEEEFEERRDNYFDLIHGNYPEWRALNKQNHALVAEERLDMLQSRATESFIDGAIEAEWKERGSNDVPGNIRISDYHEATEDIYVIGDGGTLWKGNLDGDTWSPLNDGIQFGRKIIKVVDLPEGGVRIITANTHIIRYSDDNGETWTEASGFAGTTGSGNAIYQLNDDNNTLVYLYRQAGGAPKNKIAYSVDNGASFTFVSNLTNTSENFVSMHMANGSDIAYVLDNNDDLYKFEGTALTLISEDLGLDGSNRCMIRVNESGGTTTLYALFDNSKFYKSTDSGASFDFVSTFETSTWGVGFNVAIDNPNIIYTGDVNLRKSVNSGETFDIVSEWWEYYGDVENKIHADIMAISPFKKADGTEFTLVCNHGGISVSYDNLATTPNIAMQDLNTGQFYDVLTSPNNSALIYGGTQDQGYQRTLDGNSAEPSSFEQVISGDYGEMQFTNDGVTLWIQYPGAWFQIYSDAETDGGYAADFNIDGSNMPNYDWIVPTGAAPHAEDDFIYAAGGNLDGGSGSYLIKMQYDGVSVNASQYDFNFYGAAGAAISAIETTPLQDEFIYIVTENGRFFHSENEGDSFEMTPSYYGPSGGWIYTADIYASRKTPGLVFVGGSNYGSSSVYMSTDSAKTFTSLSEGIPNTMVHEMTMDPNEKFLFAATDAGPYAYSMEDEEWYYIGGLSAPIQDYISVEFIPSEYIVRFATWGRGIWDLNITAVAGLDQNLITEEIDMNLYPNPSNSDKIVNVSVLENGTLSLFSINGTKAINDKIITSGTTTLDYSNLTNGTYILSFTTESGIVKTQKIILK